MDFVGKLAELQRSASCTADYAARRAAAFRTLAPMPGETILDVGCGSGLFARDIATAVGSSGKVCGIDLSEDQLAAARVNCAQVKNVELDVGNVLTIPYPAAPFDAVVSIQVLEYVADVSAALAEMHRVLRPGGRIVNFATIWATSYWNSLRPDVTQTMLKAWDTHAPHPNLPCSLPALLVKAGFSTITQSPLPLLNRNYRPDDFGYWLAQIIATFAVQRGTATEDGVAHWLRDLSEMGARNEYLFCSLAVVTSAVKRV